MTRLLVLGLLLYTVYSADDIPKLTDEQRAEDLKTLLDIDWKVLPDRDAIYKEFVFLNFNEAFTFMTQVALHAEKVNHHPEWFNIHKTVEITLSTNESGGLTMKDIEMGKFIEKSAKGFKPCPKPKEAEGQS